MAQREFLLPDLGEGLEEAEVVSWRIAEGDTVELNQPLVEVNTEKALVEIPSPFAGTVVKLHGAEGDVILVGKPLVTFDLPAGGEEAKTAPRPSEAAARREPEGVPDQAAAEGGPDDGGSPGGDGQAARPKRRAVLVGYGAVEDEPEPAAVERPSGRKEGGGVAATPPVRRLAKELGIDLAAVEGSGPGGRVTREDVERAAAEGPAGARVAAQERIPVRGTRRLVAEKMARSAREIPHVTTFLTVDAHWLQEFRAELAEASGERVSPLAVIVRALADTCREFPKLNATFDAEASEIVLYRDCHVGIATDTDRGLVVTVVRDVASRGVLDVQREISDLATAAREGTVRPEQMSGSTITVSNVGTFGAEYGTPIINHPEAAILATGVIEPRALVVEGRLEARPAMTLSLSFDHRLLDGAEAGRALRALGDVLESPFRLGALPR